MSARRKPSTSIKQKKLSISWTDALEAITINDDHWWCMTTMMVETLPTHYRIVRLFEEAAEEGSRKAIYHLSFKKMMSSVKALSKPDEEKGFAEQGVLNHANKLVARGEYLEPWLIARLVKYLVYRAKIEMLERIKNESDLEREKDQNIQSMLTAPNGESQRMTKSTKSQESSRAFDITLKPNTRLRKRGEERKDKVWIDDGPEDGPQLFIILTGFRNPDLPLEIIKAGVPLTCVLKMKAPGETFIISENSERSQEKMETEKERGEGSAFGNLTENALNEFWSTLEKNANDRNNLEAFSNVIFRNFCPPEISSYADLEEIKGAKKDLYDRVSYITYDLFDLKCLHSDYIRCMSLQDIPEESRKEMQIYTKIMADVPTECSFISVILQAMLAQVEADLQDDQTETDAENITISKRNNLSSVRERSMLDNYIQSPFDRDYNRYDHLNEHRSNVSSFQRVDQIKRSLSSKKEPKLILECDQLYLQTYHIPLGDNTVKLVNPQPTSLAELAERSFRDPRIVDLWTNHDHIPDDTIKKYRNYLRKIARCFDVQMDPKVVEHYLHLYIFEKIIHGQLKGISAICEGRRTLIAQKDAILFATHSDPFPLSSKAIQDNPTFLSDDNPISNPRYCRSDTIIDYHMFQSEIVGSSEMFNVPKNSRKMFGEFDASLEASNEKLVPKEKETESLYLEEFIDVRLLSTRTLPQAIQECFQRYQSFHSKYIEITDSMLLCFGDVDDPQESSCIKENIGKQILRCDDSSFQRTLRILTPVCFRNFCEYIIHEEKDFIRDIEVSRAAKRSLSAGDLTKKLSYHSDISILGSAMKFSDDDFILPNSLKGHARRKNHEANSPKEGNMISKINDSQTIRTEDNDKTKKKKSSLKKNSGDVTSTGYNDVNDVSMKFQKKQSLRSNDNGKNHKFEGYNLGKFRIQVTSHGGTFVSEDGTLVKVVTDEWLYGKKYLGISIDLSGCFLKLQNALGGSQNENMPFHLITENGIVMAFLKVYEAKESSSLKENQSNFAFEFRASLPSGLLVEPIIDNGNENPFYIMQKYISKGPECGNVSLEIYRKFLRNGTVLKFLNGNEIEVLCPNGTIVRCLEYSKFSRDFIPGNYGNLNKAREKRKSSKNIGEENNRNRSMMTSTLDPSFEEIHSSGEDAARVKITRYTAVEYDGRRYEVENDEVSRVYDRSLVRTRTDVEACEKFIRRDDGTQSILNSMGQLLVSFPDGTRIITGYVIEDEPLYCDWSDDEFTRFFGDYSNGNPKHRRNDEEFSMNSSNVTGSESRRSESRHSTIHDDKLDILLSDSFVSILMTCRMEHECYVTVAYEPIKNSCQLSMPNEVEVQIKPDGIFDISIGQNKKLLINRNEIIFSSKINENDRSVTIYNLREKKLTNETTEKNETLLITTDSKGKIFEVKVDGSIVGGNDAMSHNFEKKHRLFAIKRDFTGCEYIHKSHQAEYLKKACEEGSSSICISLQPHCFSDYRLFLNALEPTNYSKKWLQKVTRIRQPDRNWIDFSRSTYANPYNWLFPFGRHGNAEKKDAWEDNVSIVKNGSKVLTLTILEGIAKDGDRFLRKLEKAMARCKMSMSDVFDNHRSIDTDESSAISLEKQAEKILNDLSFGIETNIHELKRLRDLSIRKSKHESSNVQSTKPDKLELETEEIQWYKRCIKERIILPYFENTRGFCFLWIMSCVDKALELVEQ